MRVKTGKEITETIIMGIFFAGVIPISAPFLAVAAIPEIVRYMKRSLKDRQEKKNFQSIFSRLKNQGLIKITNRNGQIYISLTREGKKKAGKYQINNLRIKDPKKWDKKWRILIFDIKNEQRIKREALRGKIKELGLFQLQKSVWIYPHNFFKEIKLLRDFFGFTNDEMQIITADKIENDKKAREFFGLK